MRSMHAFGIAMLLGGSAGAEKIPVDDGASLDGGGLCDGWYDVVLRGDGAGIPDCDPDGIMLGPLVLDGYYLITGVLLEVDIDHTWVGDLRLQLFFDEDCDGTPEVGPMAALCRPGLAGCDADGCCGCSGNLVGIYHFVEPRTGIDPLGEPVCPGDFPPGCYAEAPDTEVSFGAMDSGSYFGGCFTLFAADGACADTGTIHEWAVHVELQHYVPARPTTWSRLKSRYR